MTSDKLQLLLGSNINLLRQNQSLTVEKLAEKSGLSNGHLMDIIHGRKWISSDSLARIAEALSVPVSVLFTQQESNGLPVELLITEMGKELSVKLSELVQETSKSYLKKASEKA